MKTFDFNFDQVAGMSRIYAIPAPHIREITTDPLTGYSRLSLTTSEGIIEIPVLSQQNTIFDEQQQTKEAVNMFNVSITVFIPRHTNPALIRGLERGEWVVIHQDANGDILLSGTTDIPLTFQSHRQTTEQSPTGNYGEFTAVEPEQSIHIDRRAFYL